jgi:hypothetical protein
MSKPAANLAAVTLAGDDERGDLIDPCMSRP